MGGLVGGHLYACPSCGLPRKRRKYPKTATCRYCRWIKRQGWFLGASIPGLPDRISSKIEITAGCWLWRSTLNSRGYGVIGKGGKNGGMALAHRVVFEHLVRPIPAGHHLHHHHECERICVNPAHMTILTPSEHQRLHPENNRSWREKMEHRTHCLKGHEMTRENTYNHPNGSRKCRECRRAERVGRIR